MDGVSGTDERAEALARLKDLGCAVVLATFDRRSGSYAIGHADGSGYFTATWDSEGKALDWAAENLARIERHVRREESIEPNFFVLERVAEAAQASGDDAVALRAALEPRWDEIREDADLLGDRGVDAVLDEIESAEVAPAEAVSRIAGALYLPNPLEGPSPR